METSIATLGEIFNNYKKSFKLSNFLSIHEH